MRQFLCFAAGFSLLITAAVAGAQENITAVSTTTSGPEILLWPDGAPGALGSTDKDKPSLTPWIVSPDKASGAAMVVCPGGGYAGLADHEGSDYARWLNEMGISAFVLKYRLGTSGYHHPAMLNDASRAMRIVRSRAGEWHIDPSRIGIIGSSAGGHLASSVLTHFNAGDSSSTDTIEQQSSRPALGILCYPVITMGDQTHKGSKKNLLGENPSADLVHLMSNDEQVTSSTPPTFIFHTADDTVVPVENSLMFATALAGADVPFEMHIYPHGKHGLGLGDGHTWNPAKRHPWVGACEAWLKANGFCHK